MKTPVSCQRCITCGECGGSLVAVVISMEVIDRRPEEYAARGAKVYDVTSYLDDHPGGAEVMLDVGGKDADEFFEDIGHSNDAREELAKHVVGVLKLTEEEKEKRRLAAEKKSGADSGGMSMIAVLVAAAGIGYYFYKQKVDSSE
eukprot:scaffold37615_cov155-Skeletonema_dohrnii-CCMP3373.AAC.3